MIVIDKFNVTVGDDELEMFRELAFFIAKLRQRYPIEKIVAAIEVGLDNEF